MLDLLGKTKEICRLFKISPARSKGQNFLVSSKIYDDIVKAANILSSDEILEVGPGLGFLTVRLARVAKRVVAVELDDSLATYLQTGLEAAGQETVKVINQDILKFNPSEEFSGPYKIVANLPYNISSIFLRSYLSAPHKPQTIVLMLQKEVAQRIVAQPGDMSLLAVSVQHYAEASIIQSVSATNFWPVPEVESAIVYFNLKDNIFDKTEDRKFFRLVKAGFGAKRKMLKNNLVGSLQISPDKVAASFQKANILEKTRAEDLSLSDWYKLFAAISNYMV
jgi:16S rRNA (adenine1518-N6/adenine1519-N6)-dimethyltransferase